MASLLHLCCTLPHHLLVIHQIKPPSDMSVTWRLAGSNVFKNEQSDQFGFYDLNTSQTLPCQIISRILKQIEYMCRDSSRDIHIKGLMNVLIRYGHRSQCTICVSSRWCFIFLSVALIDCTFLPSFILTAFPSSSRPYYLPHDGHLSITKELLTHVFDQWERKNGSNSWMQTSCSKIQTLYCGLNKSL